MCGTFGSNYKLPVTRAAVGIDCCRAGSLNHGSIVGVCASRGEPGPCARESFAVKTHALGSKLELHEQPCEICPVFNKKGNKGQRGMNNDEKRPKFLNPPQGSFIH